MTNGENVKKFEIGEGDKKKVCKVDFDKKTAQCELKRKVGDYGWDVTARETYEVDPLMKGENKIRTRGEGMSDKEHPEDMTELRHFAANYLPQWVKAHGRSIKKEKE